VGERVWTTGEALRLRDFENSGGELCELRELGGCRGLIELCGCEMEKGHAGHELQAIGGAAHEVGQRDAAGLAVKVQEVVHVRGS
jgi:hypothetical protein